MLNMNENVPTLSIVFMVISCLIAFLVPVGLLLYFRIKKKADILPFFVGCAVMLIFAFVLEQLAHSLILGSAAGIIIQKNTLLYALYGGLMAGLFEETGRFVAFKTVLKRKQEKDQNALMYGAGHGGFEAIVILGLAMINNIIYSVFLNTGHTEVITNTLSGDALTKVEMTFTELATIQSYQFLLGGVERLLVITLQISFSVLVWFAAKKKDKLYLYPVAVLMHLVVDSVAVLMSQNGVSVLLIEGVLCLLTLVCVWFAKRVWENCQPSENRLNYDEH